MLLLRMYSKETANKDKGFCGKVFTEVLFVNSRNVVAICGLREGNGWPAPVCSRQYSTTCGVIDVCVCACACVCPALLQVMLSQRPRGKCHLQTAWLADTSGSLCSWRRIDQGLLRVGGEEKLAFESCRMMAALKTSIQAKYRAGLWTPVACPEELPHDRSTQAEPSLWRSWWDYHAQWGTVGD